MKDKIEEIIAEWHKKLFGNEVTQDDLAFYREEIANEIRQSLMSEEEIRLELLKNIGWFMQEWEDRPKSGKGSDRSDLLKRLAHTLSGRIAKQEDKVCPHGLERHYGCDRRL